MLVRRVVVFAALVFWLGGTTFYGAVVVPVGRQLLGSAQSLVTREVTAILNYASLVALPILAWDIVAARDPSQRRAFSRWVCWGISAAAVPVMFWLHHELGAQMDGAAVGRDAFHVEHRVYLAVGGGQWLAAASLAVLTLAAWRSEDRQVGLAQDCRRRSSASS